jgi:hypothetical protein
MNFRPTAALSRRLAAAEQAIDERWQRHAVSLLVDIVDDAPAPVRDAVAARIRPLHQRRENDPAWHPDAVTAFLAVVAEAAPDIAQRIAGGLGIKIGIQSAPVPDV